MADGFQRLITAFFKDVKLFGGMLSGPDLRQRIRRSIADTLPDLNPSEQEALLNLRQSPPQALGWSISISHAHNIGGWIGAPFPAKVGFDIECLERITHQLVKRISSDEELNSSPDPRFLWPAKEALFKLKSKPAEVKVISQVSICKWTELPDGLFAFTGSAQETGVVSLEGPLIYAGCLVKGIVDP